ncbi:MAG: hypothetical protein HKO65_08265 [Gemmatimonadetes bacterium]|nr:hypothetical protein [Gemmatimonadota bacterium]NNM05081.1 hypothetical protein [Gemmatimonadota bacterium]
MKRITPAPIPFLIAFLALLGTAPALTAQEAAAFEGHWEGEIVVPNAPIEINVDLMVSEEGVWSGDISIPAQMAQDVPLADVKVDGTKVSFMMAGVPGEPTFSGTLSEDGQTITGPFTQSGAELEFKLTKKDP